ncbi:molybdopterin converting factor subunit 1 [Stakelama sediminis]|uniref:Molybdopterin synthase sulfur carrier subunit n=1 Tax=Stakelama sediminis TaxID=463200 RepID=A0A840Z0V1_9SPHN|nr:molybdopterin synthase sulfur carrier subunit [Stakelama sediminis]
MLTILYFAWVREAVGKAQEEIAPPPSVTTVAELVGWLATQGEGYAEAFADPGRLRAALDQEFVSLDVPLGSAREVALFPPVTGG